MRLLFSIILFVAMTVNCNAAGFQYGGLRLDAATTATAAATTTLTNASKQIQEFTGSTTQNVALPDASTLSVGYWFEIVNASTGAVTVKDGSGSTLKVLGASTTLVATVRNIGSSAGAWILDAHYGNFSSSTITGSFVGALTGNASTATALASNPSDCASDRYATAIDASANFTCSTVSDAGLAVSYIKADGTRAFTGDQSMGSHKITNVTDPGSAQDAATKAYVDAQVTSGGSNMSQQGAATWLNTANCDWVLATSSFSNYSADTDCPAPTIVNNSGNVSATGTKLPGVVIANVTTTDTYYFIASGQFGKDSSLSAAIKCSFRFSDGTDSSNVQTVRWPAGTGVAFIPVLSGRIKFGTTGTKTVLIQSKGDGTTPCDIDVSDDDADLDIRVWKIAP
jgi:hypothetical protein